MAQIHKAGARKPRIENGFVYTKCEYTRCGPEFPRSVMAPFEYKLSVSAHGANLGGEYTVQLTEAEMLRTIAEWMAMYARNRARELETKHATPAGNSGVPENSAS